MIRKVPANRTTDPYKLSVAMFNLPMQNLFSVDTDWDFGDPDLVGGPVQGSGLDASLDLGYIDLCPARYRKIHTTPIGHLQAVLLRRKYECLFIPSNAPLLSFFSPYSQLF
jgi:hypothetical protein